ncbi:MAG TPA: hypothetical protein ENH82_17915 [bacterium]|nr:hypothetical protein [bacterium]
MKITLSVKDRLVLPGLLPKQGSMIDLEIASNIRDNIKFTPKEIEQLQFKDRPDRGVVWVAQAEVSFEAEFENSEIELIKQGIDQLDKGRQMTSDQYDLSKRINKLKE